MSLVTLTAGVLLLGAGLGAPELPSLLERAGAARGMELSVLPLGDPPQALPRPLPAHLVLPPGAAAAGWADLVLEAAPSSQVWVIEAWPQFAPQTAAQQTAAPQPAVSGGGAHTDADWQAALDLAQTEARQKALELGAGAKVIPVARTLAAVDQAIAAGELRGLYHSADLYRADGGLNDRGLYLVTMVLVARLTASSPEGLPARLTRLWMSRDSVVDADLAQDLQRLVWQVATVPEPARSAPPGASASRSTAPLSPTPPSVASPAPAGAEPAPILLVQTAQLLAPSAQPGPEAPSPVTPAPPDQVTALEVTAPGIAFNLAEIADWSSQQPFLDVIKTARPWIGHRDGQWGSYDTATLRAGGFLAADGWPRAVPPDATGLSTLVLTDLPADAGGVAGRYLLRYQGTARLKLEGPISGLQARPGEIRFDYHPGPGGVILTLEAIEAADPIRAMTLVREDRRSRLDAGEIFNPDWLQRLRGAELLRFMDWGRTNGATLARLQDQPQIGDFSWVEKGAPYAIMLALANNLGADAWFTLPHLAEDDLVRDLARQVHAGLAPGRRAYVEYSNEVWNHIFPQASWAEAEGRARWGQQWKWVQYYALRAAEVATIWAEVFADQPERLVRVLGTQTGWMGLEVDILDAPLVQAEGRPAPHTAFDMLAVTAYVSGGIGGEEKAGLLRGWLERSRAAAEAEATRQGLSGPAREAHITEHRFDLAIDLALEEMRDGRHSGNPHDTLDFLYDELLPWARKAASARGLELVMYEGGTHAVGIGGLQQDDEITAFLARLNYAPGMGRLYRDLVDRWQAFAATPFNAFVDVQTPSKYGSWGALRHLGDDNPRWRALAKGSRE